MENKEIMDVLKTIVDNMATKDEISSLRKELQEEIRASETRTTNKIKKLEIQIENNVSKKIDALFDGYTLTHEKQFELEHRVDKLEERLEDVSNWIA